MTQLRFDDRVAVITGAGRGLGRAYALLLAARGAKVVVNDPGASLQGDSTDAGPAQAVVREIEAAGGEAVACTESVATPAGGKAIIQSALDGYGRIVLTGSINGLYGNRNAANYSVAKAGLIGLSYPPMDPELVAPAVGWLAHESCSVTGEMLVAMAGRVARAYAAETPGVYHPAWSIEQAGEEIDAIRNTDAPVVFPVVPSGHVDHLRYSFGMAAAGGEAREPGK